MPVEMGSNGDDGPRRGGAVFVTTHWSAILSAGQGSSQVAEQALAELCRTYWRPLYAYVRRSGHSEEDAKDLTQEFFARFLARNYFSHACPAKGRFRTFLLASLRNFLTTEWKRGATIKRGGDCSCISWDALEVCSESFQGPECEVSAERIYERQWALTLLENVFARLREECAVAGKERLFDTLKVYLSGEKSGVPQAEAAAALKMTAGAVQVAVHRLRRRYGELVRAEITHTVNRSEDIDEEIRHLFRVLGE